MSLRTIGREIGRRKTIWDDPHLYVWGWQSPLNFYARLDSPTRHFFVDNLLRDQAGRDHPLIQPRIDEIMLTLKRRPPELIYAARENANPIAFGCMLAEVLLEDGAGPLLAAGAEPAGGAA